MSRIVAWKLRDGDVLCVPCVNATDADIWHGDVDAVFDEDPEAQQPCARCKVKLEQANIITRCEHCSGLHTLGGRPGRNHGP